MNFLWTFIVPYCTLAFGIHGGEFISGINRQVRNFLCAAPFALVAYQFLGTEGAAAAFTLAFIGTDLGFNWSNENNWRFYASLSFKGFVTFPFFGAVLLPIAYFVGMKTKSKNVFAEYFSGLLYGVALLVIMFFNEG